MVAIIPIHKSHFVAYDHQQLQAEMRGHLVVRIGYMVLTDGFRRHSRHAAGRV